MIGWVLSGFSAGSQKVNNFQKVDKNDFKKIEKKCKRNAKEIRESRLSMGARLGSQWVLSGSSAGTP